MVLVDSHRVFVAGCDLDHVADALNLNWFAHEIRSSVTKSKLPAFVGAPRIHVSIDRNRQRVLVAAADLLDELVLECSHYPRIQDLLDCGFLGKVGVGVETKLSLGISAP